jgi:hypothetical protein
VLVRTAGRDLARPERDSSRGEGERWQERERRQQGARDADRADRPERLVRVQVAQQQAEQSRDHGAGTRGDGLERSAKRGPRRIPSPFMVAQCLAVARNVEQGVVGRGTDHEDEQDALHLAVDLHHTGLREPPHHEDRQTEREHRRAEHDERQQRRAVDDDQDHEHGTERDEQQQAVDAGERVDEVCGESGRARDVRGEAVGKVGERGVDGGDRVIHVAFDRHDQLHCVAVVGFDRRADAVADTVHPREVVGEGGECVAVVIGEPAVARRNDDGGDVVGARELRQQARDLGGVRAGRQIARLVVGGHLADATEVRTADRARGEPRGDEHGGNEDAQELHSMTSVMRTSMSCSCCRSPRSSAAKISFSVWPSTP